MIPVGKGRKYSLERGTRKCSASLIWIVITWMVAYLKNPLRYTLKIYVPYIRYINEIRNSNNFRRVAVQR